MSYYKKYMKYKNKYLELNHNLQLKGGADINDNVYDNSNKYLSKIKKKIYIFVKQLMIKNSFLNHQVKVNYGIVKNKKKMKMMF